MAAVVEDDDDIAASAAVFTTSVVFVVVEGGATMPKLGTNSGTLGFSSGLIVVVAMVVVMVSEEEAVAVRPFVRCDVVVVPAVVAIGIGRLGASDSRGQNVGFFFGRN